ncbi:MAG: hypothetical protein AB1643_02325 [Patescibacteria group bacterium]
MKGQKVLTGIMCSNRIEVLGATSEHKKALEKCFGERILTTLKEKEGLLKIRPIKDDLISLALDIGESDLGNFIISVPIPDNVPVEHFFAHI